MLIGAALHAGWNATLKVRLEPFVAMTLINVTCAIFALPLLIWTGMPARESWPWAAASITIHCFYFLTLTEAYRRADMSVVYPIARGSAPMLTALVAIIWLKEPIGLAGACGIALLGTGIIVMTLRPRGGQPIDPMGLFYAGLTAVIISAYTVSDGTGARASGDPIAYSALLFVLNGIVPVALAVAIKGWRPFLEVRHHLVLGLAGGLMSFGSYTIAIWAMALAPIALVAAVRETSVLFAAAIAVIFLKEPLRINRLIAAALIVSGLILIRIQ